MTSFKKPKVYFGAGGFTGVGTIGKSPIVGAKKPMVYGGGVSAAKVLTGGGISRGGVIGLTPSPSIVTKPKPEKRLEEFSKAMEMARESKRETAVDRNPPKAVEAVGVYAPAKVEEAAIEPQTNPPTMAVLPELPAEPKEESGEVPQVEVTMAELPKYTGFSKGEWGTGAVLPDPPPETEETIAARVAETGSVTTPELPLGGDGGKKKRRRRRRH